jgi:transcriptional regulator with XRE-family HTH domain
MASLSVMRCNGAALRIIRERSGLSVSALAKEVGISQPHLTNIERGDRQASPDVMVKLASALKIELPAILADPEQAAS